jgi:amino-acid N-acetyltransferase
LSARLRQANAADLPLVERLLLDAGLITAGVPEHISDFLLAEEDGRIVGSAALERYGAQALLRSVAVTPEHRNRGLARDLVSRLLDDAAGADVREIYLFTSTAPGYFRRFGFVPIGRDDIAQSVRASAEYGECCSDAQAMMLHLRV